MEHYFDLDNIDIDLPETLSEKVNDFQNLFMCVLKSNDVYKRYKFNQFSNKSNEIYYTHAIKGIYLGSSLFTITNDKEIQQYKVFCTAYLIHDLNKIYLKYENVKDRDKIWSIETVTKELKVIDTVSDGKLTEAFPEWRDYMEEIYHAVRGHSYTYNYNMSLLMGYATEVESGNHFTQDDMMYIVTVMQCVDLTDVIISSSGDMIELEMLDKNGNIVTDSRSQRDLIRKICDMIAFIDPMNTKDGYHIENIHLTRSIDFYENMKLNVIRDAIVELYDVMPFIDTFDGVFFIIPNDVYTTMFNGNQLKSEVIKSIYKNADAKFRHRFKTLIHNGTIKGKTLGSDAGGLKPDTYFKSTPNEDEKIKQLFDFLRSDDFKGLNYNPPKNGEFDASSSRYTQVTQSMRKYIKTNSELLDVWNEDQRMKELIEDDELWKISYALRTIFFLLTEYKERMKGKNSENFEKLLDGLYQKLGIYDEMKPLNTANTSLGTSHTRSNGIHHVPSYVIKYVKKLSQEEFFNLCEEYVLECIQRYPSQVEFDIDVQNALKKSVRIFNQPFEIAFNENHTNYQCSHCGTQLPIGKKMSTKKIHDKYQWTDEFSLSESKVEAFSNFLNGGSQKRALRLVCDDCKFKMYVNKLSISVDDDDKTTFYIHSYYPSAVSHAFVRSLQRSFRTLQKMKNGIMKLDLKHTKPLILAFDENEESIDWTRSMEAPIPFETSGYISTTQKFIKKSKKKQYSYTDQYWKAFKSVVEYALKTNMKTIMSKFQTIPIDVKVNVAHLIEIQDYPDDFNVFMDGKDGLTFDEAEKIWKKINVIEKIVKRVIPATKAENWIPEYINFIRNHSRNIENDIDFIVKLATYYGNFNSFVNYDCIELLEQYYTLCDIQMTETNIQKMAELTLKQNSKDPTQSKYQKAKSLSILFDQLEERCDEPVKDVLMDVRTRIIDSLVEDDYYKKHASTLGIKVDTFVDLAERLIEDDFNGNIEKILDRSQSLKNTYVGYMDRYIIQKGKEKKEREQKND